MTVVTAKTNKIVLIATIVVLCRPLLLITTQSADLDEVYQNDHQEGVHYTKNRTSCLAKRMKRAIPLEEIRDISCEAT